MKDIPNYEGLYAATEDGHIWSYKSKKFLKEETNNGYKRVSLFKDGAYKHYRVHRLIAETFIPNPNGLPQVNHIDEDRSNNCVNNLEWCTQQYNNDYSQSRRILCEETGVIYKSMSEAARALGCSKGSFCSQVQKTGKYYNMHWRLV